MPLISKVAAAAVGIALAELVVIIGQALLIADLSR